MSISRFKKGVPGFGFDAFGYPLKYDTASAAGCEISRIPKRGLVFYAPLDKEASSAVTGQNIETVGTVSYSSVQGIPSMTPQSESYLLTSDNGFPASGNPRSVSFWVYLKEAIQRINSIFAYGAVDKNSRYSIAFSKGNILNVYGSGNTATFGYSFATSQWYHIVVMFSNNQSKLYVDGDEASEWINHPDTINTVLCDCCIGAISDDHVFWADECNIASVKLYDRVLSEDEIKALSEEFKL